ncbi:MAG: response regulator transcription factor [Thermoleophilaceae bacterium]
MKGSPWYPRVAPTRAAFSSLRTTTTSPSSSRPCWPRTVACKSSAARHGREALTMAASLNPDVILMDLQMPVMDGAEATRRLRALRSTARIVVLTGVEDVGLIKEARDAGADTFVTKVRTQEHLMSIVLAERPAA